MKQSSRKSFTNEALLAIGKRIREARGDDTQADFASSIGVDRATLSNYEKGRRLPNAIVLDQIELMTGKSSGFILFGADSTFDLIEDSFRDMQRLFTTMSQEQPGFFHRWFFSDFEIALIRCFREAGTQTKIDAVELLHKNLVEFDGYMVEDGVEPAESRSIALIKTALDKREFPKGADLLREFWPFLRATEPEV